MHVPCMEPHVNNQEKKTLVQNGIHLEDLTDFAVHIQCDADQAVALVNELYEMYIPENLENGSGMLLQTAYELCGLSPDMKPDLMQVEVKYRKRLFQVLQVYQQLLMNEMIGIQTNETLQNQRKISQAFEVLYLIRDMIMADQRWKSLCDPATEVRMPEEVQIFKFSPFDYTSTTDYQNLLIFLLHQAYKKGYRRLGDACYEQIKTIQGYNTHAWRRVCTIREMIHRVIQKESNFQMWKALTKSSKIDDSAATYLEHHEDVEFPRLNVNRHVFAFKNGLLMLGGFKKDANSMITEDIMPEFHPYDTYPVSDNVVACKYFDLDFNYEDYFKCDDWFDIPTPAFQSIMDYQQFGYRADRTEADIKQINDDVSRMMYIMCGRLMYNVGEYDSWQVIPFLHGVANSGKSSILRAIYTFYNAENVGIMSSNMEKKFWAQGIYDKFVFLCYEAREDFSINQGEFQSAVSGEEMSVAVKYKTAISLTWTVPGIMAGNVFPNWIDAVGSMSRRLITFLFKKMVTRSDPTLLNKMRAEIPALMFKCNMAYLLAVREHGNQPVWLWWPSYFSDTQKDMATKIDPLRTFLEHTDELVRGMSYFMPLTDFIDQYRTFTDQRNMSRRGNINEDKFTTVFEAYGFAITREETRVYEHSQRTCKWVIGIGPRSVWENHPQDAVFS